MIAQDVIKGRIYRVAELRFKNAALDPFKDGNGAVAEIAADNAADEWFDLQGRKVNNPEKGIYIRKQGADTQKVVLR